MPAPDTAERLTPISRALFAELEGVDTRSVNKFKWDQIIQSHLKLELELAAARAALSEAMRRIEQLAGANWDRHQEYQNAARQAMRALEARHAAAIEAARGKP